MALHWDFPLLRADAKQATMSERRGAGGGEAAAAALPARGRRRSGERSEAAGLAQGGGEAAAAPLLVGRPTTVPFICSILLLLLLLCFVPAHAYDPLDPHANITIKWDFMEISETYAVSVSVHNNQLYRHIEDPGWRLSWVWAGDEVILDAKGAEATEQGNCTRAPDARSCEKKPVMADLPPGTPFAYQVANCCRGSVLSSRLEQNNKKATSAFMMVVGKFAQASDGGPKMPGEFGLGVPGYTCSNATSVPPSRTQTSRQRYIQALSMF